MYFTKQSDIYGDHFTGKWSKISARERDDLHLQRRHLERKVKSYDFLVARLLPLCLLGLGCCFTMMSFMPLSSPISIPALLVGIGMLVAAVVVRLMRSTVRRHYENLQQTCDRQIEESTIDVPRSLIDAATDYMNKKYSHKKELPLNHMELDDYDLWLECRREKSKRVHNWLEAFPEDFYELLVSVGDIGLKVDETIYDRRQAVQKRFAKLVKPAFDRIAELHKLEDERKALEEKEAQKQRNLEYIEAKRRQWDEAEAVIEGITALDRAINQG